MKRIQILIWMLATLVGVEKGLSQTSGAADLSTRSAGVPPARITVDSVTKWIENPLDQKLQIAVTNLYADTNACMEIVIGGQRVKFFGAGTDPFGNYIPTNYAPVVVNAVLRREYPMSIVCPNSGPNGSPLFKIGDLDPNNFLPVLTNSPTDAVSAYLWTNFSSGMQFALTNTSASWPDQQTNLTSEINRILSGPSIYNATRFSGVTLQPDTEELLTNSPAGQQIVRLNHYLVRDAYATMFWIPTGNPDNSGTAEITFSVKPPPELKVKKNQPAAGYSVVLDPDTGNPGVLNLQHPADGDISTNYSALTVLKDRFGHFGLGDGCDDATKAPGQGSWLSMGPGCTQDTNRISLEWHVGLGRTFDGLAAGVLTFREPGLTRDSYTPYAIYYNGSLTNLYAQMPLGSPGSPYVPTNYYASVTLVTTNVPFVLTNSAGQPYTNYDSLLRQVKSCQAFVDILAPDTNQTVLNFYHANQVLTNQDQNGLYTNFVGSPFVTWTVKNPDPSTTSKLLIYENRNGSLSTNSLAQTTSAGVTTWTLSQGSGAATRVETRQVSFNGTPATNRVELDTVEYSGATTPTYQCKETYNFFSWGSELVETRVIGSPDQVTSYEYYTDPGETYGYYGYGQLKQIVYPDGYWEKRVYEDVGEGIYPDSFPYYGVLTYLLHPYLDANGTHGEATSPDEATPYNTSFVKFAYVRSGSGGYGRDSVQVEGVNGLTPIGNAWESGNYPGGEWYNWPGAEGSGTETTDWTPFCEATPASQYGAQTFTYSDAAAPGLAGHTFWVHSFSGPSNPERLFYYDQGTYSAGSFVVDTNNHLLTWDGVATNYPDFRQTELVDALNGVDYYYSATIEGHQVFPGLTPLKTKRNTRIYQNGNLVQTEAYFYSQADTNEDGSLAAPEWALLSTMRYSADSLGRTTNVIRIDPVTGQSRTVYSADYRGALGYDGPLLLSETDEKGAKTSYTYDGLQRPITVTTTGYGAQPNRTVTLSYDANNQMLTQSVSAGGLTQLQTQAFDFAGRQTNSVDASGIAVSTSYSANNRSQTSTYPGGITVTKDFYTDRRVKDMQGNGVVNQFYNYTLYSNPLFNWYNIVDICNNSVWPLKIVSLGSTNSARWHGTGQDSSGFNALDIQPVGAGTTNTIWTAKIFMDGMLETIRTSGESPNMYFNYDACGRTNIAQISPSNPSWWGSGVGEDAFPYIFSDQTRVSFSTSYPTLIGGAWYQATTNYTCLTDGSSESTISSIHLEQLNGFQSSEIARTIDYDADTNETINVVYLDRTQNKLTLVTTKPSTSVLSATNIYQNGLLLLGSTLSVASPTLYFYDALGRTNRIQSSLGFSTYMTYDLTHGWLTGVTDPAGDTTSFDYYGVTEANAGKIKVITDASGKKTYSAYTTRGELYRTWGDVPYPAEHHYNEFGDLTNLITFRGGSGWNSSSWPGSPGTGDNTFWQYDDVSGALVKKLDASGAYVSYTYDTNSARLLSRTWARTAGGQSVSVTNSYDSYGKLTSQEYTDGNPNVYFNNFNRAGKPREIIDGSGTNELTYDFASRLISTTCTNGLLAGITVGNHFSPTYGRDMVVVTGIATPLTNAFGHDAYGRLEMVSNGVFSATYGYLPNSGLLQTTTCESNATVVLTTSRSWDYGYRLSSIANSANGSVVTSDSYVYDVLNRRTKATLEDGSYWQYGYNDRSELTGAQRHWLDLSLVAGQQFGFTYDNIGNRVTTTSGGDALGANLRTNSYTVNNLNQYTSVTIPMYKDIIGVALATNTVMVNGNTASRHGEYFRQEIGTANSGGAEWQGVFVASGTFTNSKGLALPKSVQSWTYDSDGNLTYDGVWNYQWDAENRLVSMNMTNISGIVNSNRLRLDFVYDYLGRRVQKVISMWNGSGFSNPITNKFVYDGFNLIAILDSGNSVLKSFMWGADLGGDLFTAGSIGGLLMVSQPNSCNFVAYDGNGNVTALVDAGNKSINARYEYSPYGELIRTTGPLAHQNPFRFSTKYWDEESGLACYGVRYFNPTSGRFLNRDPHGENGGTHLYQFLLNSPINKVDALGSSPVSLGDLADVGPIADTASALFLASSFVIPPPLPGSEESWEVSATMQLAAVGMCIDIDNQLGGKLLKNVGGPAMFATLFVAGQAVGKIPEKFEPGAFLDRSQSLAAAVVAGRLDALKYIGAGAHDLMSGERPDGGPDSAEQAGYDFAKDLRNGDTEHGDLDAAVLAGAIYDDMVSPLNYASLLDGLLSGDAAGAFSALPDYAALNAWDMATDLEE